MQHHLATTKVVFIQYCGTFTLIRKKMRHPKTYQFREIVDENELEKFMRLRYETYFNSAMRNFLQINDEKIDIDIYDLHSRHFGLFCEEKPIGFIRFITNKNELYNHKVFSIGLKYKKLKKEIHGEREIKKYEYSDFPFVSYSETPTSIKDYYSNLIEKKERIIEGSRLMLIGENKGLNKVQFFMECAVVLCVLINNREKYAIVNCDGNHKRFYTQFGFKTINNSETYYLRGRAKKSSHLLSLPLTLASIPKRYHTKFEEMAEEFKTTNQIIRNI